ncbi:MAG: TraB/GumN family protein [Pseudomonadota bacterium]
MIFHLFSKFGSETVKLWLILAACALATPLSAQSWATRDLCLIDEAKVHEDIFTPEFYAAMQDRGAQIPNGVGRYWRITSDTGAVSHLWGTMHSTLPMILRLPDQVTDTIEAARVVAVETDYTQYTRPELTVQRTSVTRYSNTYTLNVPDLDIPPELLTWINERLFGLGWGDDALGYLKAASVAEILLSAPCEDFSSGIYPIQDDRIQMLGALAGAEILSLEEPGALFAKLDEEENPNLTRAMIAVYASYLDPATPKEAFATSYALYLEGRIGEMMAWDELYFEQTFPDEGPGWLDLTNDYLLRERNEVFMESALEDLRKGGVFMAVGTYHLPKDYGLVAMLREAGFRVDRVPLEGEPPA